MLQTLHNSFFNRFSSFQSKMKSRISIPNKSSSCLFLKCRVLVWEEYCKIIEFPTKHCELKVTAIRVLKENISEQFLF